MAGVREHGGKAQASLGARLLWFAALWLAGVATVAAVALLIRGVLH